MKIKHFQSETDARNELVSRGFTPRFNGWWGKGPNPDAFYDVRQSEDGPFTPERGYSFRPWVIVPSYTTQIKYGIWV